MFRLFCGHNKSLSLRYRRQSFFLILFVGLLCIGFPAHFKHRAARCRELCTIADSCELDRFIFVCRSRCTDQLCGYQREDIFLAVWQRRKVSRSNTACGDDGVVSRYLSIVDDFCNTGSMRNTKPEMRITEFYHIKSRLRHIIAEILADKPKPLAEKIAAGEDADIIEFTPSVLEGADLDDAADLVGEDMPSPSEYLSARQKDGKPLGADEIYKETWIWLKNRGCEKLVNKRLLESYSLAFARFIQCEEALSTYGLLGKHPTTGGVVASPFASLSQSYQKQANLLWYEIFDIVKQNCTTKFDGSPQDDMMEQLLRSRK